MRRTLTLFLVLLLLLSFPGCHSGKSSVMEPVTFFYLCRSDPNDIPDQVISSEIREASGHSGDLNYLLSLYLHGPLDQELKSPFPAGCELVSVIRLENTLCVTLDSSLTTLKDMRLTLACACLAKTCFSMADTDQVQIRAAASDYSESINITITKDSLLLEDNGASAPQSDSDEPQ